MKSTGHKVGKKRSDRRWEDENGVWSSQLEARIFRGLRPPAGISVRRCSAEAGDTFAYTSPVRGGSCGSCGSSEIVQRRTYTPDLCIFPTQSVDPRERRYLEIKGHFPGERRNLLRAFLKTGPHIDLRFVLQRDGKATPKLTLLEYCHQHFKRPVHIWDGQLPEDWYVFE